MERFVALLLIASMHIFIPQTLMAVEVTCQCLQSSCGPCEREDGVDFYSEKCGPALSKTKSCKRPLCVPVPNQKQCLADLQGAPKSGPALARAPAAAAVIANRSAEVILTVGEAFLIRADSNIKKAIAKKDVVLVGDRVLTGGDGRVRLRFPEFSEVFVSPGSDLLINEALVEKRSGTSKRMIMLQLEGGRVRSRVQGRYGDSESKFQIKTRAAVAGVRGTDFVVSFDRSAAEWKTEVQTLSGSVCLGHESECLDGDERGKTVAAGISAAYIAPAPELGASDADIDAAMARGTFSVLKMSESQMRALDRATDIRFDTTGLESPPATARAPAANTGSDCAAPSGRFNQCAWTCEGNPKGQKTCRTDIAGVQCVRRLCQANGQWNDPTVLSPKQGVACEASAPVVKDCGNYW